MNAFLKHVDSIKPKKSIIDFTKQALENIAFGLMVQGDKKGTLKWLFKIPDICKADINQNVTEWNMVELLLDVYEFLNNSQKVREIRKNCNELSALLRLL